MSLPQLTEVALTGGFWKEKYELNLKTTLDAVWNRFYETGRIDAFKCDWKEGMENKPHFFWDSDVAKWIEGAAYILALREDKDLRGKIEMLVDRIEQNQHECGYFNIYFTAVEPENRWKMRGCHELYCAGHLIEAAVAYHDACGDDRFLNLMKKYADYIYKVFVEEKSAAFKTPGHEEIELALFRLYRCTSEKRYLDLAMYFLNTRGKDSETKKYMQDHLPVRKQYTAEGHSVRALYLYSAMADAAAETGDAEMLKACDALFDDITKRKMYITGGLGSTYIGEAFTLPYDLPNDTAYAETCASIAMILFCVRMGEIRRDAKYHDITEKELYNGMLSGLSLSGKAFFYENPLEINLADHVRLDADFDKDCYSKNRLPITQRKEVFDCSCCPPNINRTLASLPRYIYSVDGKTVYINQFAESTLACGGICVTQKTNYPHTGKISVTVAGAEKVMFRIPDWCKNYKISCEYTIENGYAKITADEFDVELDMTPKFITANPHVAADAGKTAVMRGPVVYCAEGIDNGADLHNFYIDTSKTPVCEESEFFSLPILKSAAYRRKNTDELYCELGGEQELTEITLIPYNGFANRGDSDMRVWLNYVK